MGRHVLFSQWITHTLEDDNVGKTETGGKFARTVQKQKTELSNRGALTQKYLTTINLCRRTTGVLRKEITLVKHCTPWVYKVRVLDSSPRWISSCQTSKESMPLCGESQVWTRDLESSMVLPVALGVGGIRILHGVECWGLCSTGNSMVRIVPSEPVCSLLLLKKLSKFKQTKEIMSALLSIPHLIFPCDIYIETSMKRKFQLFTH